MSAEDLIHYAHETEFQNVLAQRLSQVNRVGDVVARHGVRVLAVDGTGSKAGVSVDFDLRKLVRDRVKAGGKAKNGRLKPIALGC